MKGNFWHKWFRKGYNTKDEAYNGKNAKTDAGYTRTRLNRLFNELVKKKEGD